MKHIILFLLMFIVSPVFAQTATPFCTSVGTQINLTTKIGSPRYITNLTKREFIARSGGKVSPYALGLTVSRLQMSGKAKAHQEIYANRICVSLQQLDVEIGFPDLTVYIDRKYSPSSCEYITIREHENYHVAVAQQAMLFFKPDIEKALSEAVRNIKPEIVTSPDDVQPALRRQFDAVMAQLDPLIQHINNKIREKNEEIDTAESYEQTRSLCRNW